MTVSVEVVSNSNCEGVPGRQALPPNACCLGIDGELWDVSNLSCSKSHDSLANSSMPSESARQQHLSSRRRNSPLNSDECSLYPPLPVVQDIPDDHDLNSIFKEVHRTRPQAVTEGARTDDMGCVIDRESLRERFLQRRSQQFAELHDIRRELQENAQRHKERQRRSTSLLQQQRNRSMRDLYSRSDLSPSSELRDELDTDLSTLPTRQTSAYSRRRMAPPLRQQRAVSSGTIEVEVTPGYYLPLRGAAETERASQQGRVGPTMCSCCCSRLYCILTAEFVLCPHCRIVCPVDFEPRQDFGRVGGVGLGMAPNDLQQLLGTSWD